MQPRPTKWTHFENNAFLNDSVVGRLNDGDGCWWDAGSASGLDFLQFSGAEIMHCSDMVFEALAVRIESLHIMQVCGRDIFPHWLLPAIEHHVTAVTSHPVLRRQYWSRNHRLPCKTDCEPAESEGLMDADPFLALRSCMNRLRAERDAHLPFLPIAEDYEPGAPRVLGEVMFEALSLLPAETNE